MEIVLVVLFFVVGLPIIVAIALVSHARSQGARPAPKSSGVGRAALKTYRAAGDVKAVARGTYGKRVVRRAAFRGLRKL